MAGSADVRITVLRRALHADVVSPYAESAVQPCERFREGQVFISREVGMPEGFCPWAWADVHKYVLVVARGGNHDGRRPGTNVACCSDGRRPVIFAIERIGLAPDPEAQPEEGAGDAD